MTVELIVLIEDLDVDEHLTAGISARGPLPSTCPRCMTANARGSVQLGIYSCACGSRGRVRSDS